AAVGQPAHGEDALVGSGAIAVPLLVVGVGTAHHDPPVAADGDPVDGDLPAGIPEGDRGVPVAVEAGVRVTVAGETPDHHLDGPGGGDVPALCRVGDVDGGQPAGPEVRIETPVGKVAGHHHVVPEGLHGHGHDPAVAAHGDGVVGRDERLVGQAGPDRFPAGA